MAMKRISIMKLYIATTIGNHLKSLKKNICKVLTIRGFRITPTLNITTVLPLYIVNPNQFTQQLRISGDYMLKILNDDKDVVFTRKFILYENLVTVPMQVKRTRTVSNVEYKHNLDFSIKSNTITFSNSFKNVKVVLLKMASSIAQ
jgi:hypothetical protein